jgi:amino acid transporter
MVSAIPSAGGVVGFGRIALGHLAGFICGVFDCITFGTSVALGSLFWANYMRDIFNTDTALLIVWSLCIYLVSFMVIMIGGSPMWNFVFTCGCVLCMIVLLYL